MISISKTSFLKTIFFVSAIVIIQNADAQKAYENGKEFFRHEGYFPQESLEQVLKSKQVNQ